MKNYRGTFLTQALSDTCVIGGALSDDAAINYTLSCLKLPPDKEQDDTRVSFLLYDENGRAQVGYQLMYETIVYVIDEIDLEQELFRRVRCVTWMG